MEKIFVKSIGARKRITIKKKGVNKTKLRCFNCGQRFKNRNEVFRNKKNFPICEDCLWELLDLEGWDDECFDWIIDDIKNKFKGKYKKFMKNFKENWAICDGCSEKRGISWSHPKDELTEINGKKYCEMCVEKLDNSKREEVKV